MSGTPDRELLPCWRRREEDRGGTFPGGMLYILERSPGVLGEVSGDCLPLPSFRNDGRFSRAAVTESLRAKETFLVCDAEDFLLRALLTDGFLLVRSIKLGSVSSRMSESGRVAVDHGGMPEVDHGGALEVLL